MQIKCRNRSGDRLAAETIAERGEVVIPSLSAELQASPDVVFICVVYALELCGDERGLRALMSAREGVRNHVIRIHLDQAIDRIRRRLTDAPD